MRDTVERNRDLKGILEQYFKFVKPAYESFIAPAAKVADLIVPRGGNNTVATDLIVRQIKSQLETRGKDAFILPSFGLLLSGYDAAKCRVDREPCELTAEIPESLCVINQTPQVLGLHTLLRNRDTPRDEFIFVSERLMQILIEKALEFVDYKPIEVETPSGDR